MMDKPVEPPVRLPEPLGSEAAPIPTEEHTKLVEALLAAQQRRVKLLALSVFMLGTLFGIMLTEIARKLWS